MGWIGSWLVAGVLGAVLSAGSASAVQAHAGLEGLVAHEFGHVLFAAGMVVVGGVAVRRVARSPAWTRFQVFLALIILWNALAFLGHLLDLRVDPGQFSTRDGRVVTFSPSTPLDWLYYFTRFDHLVLLPALGALWAALRQWHAGEDEP